MYLVIVAWLYVVVMMTVVEAASAQGSLLGAALTFVLYGVLPLSIVVYILGTPGRRRRRAQREAASAADGDGGGHAPGGAAAPVAPEREEG